MTTVYVLFALTLGVALGFATCAMLSANGKDAEPNEDTARIDWLQHKQAVLANIEGRWGVVANGKSLTNPEPSAREAVDAARKVAA